MRDDDDEWRWITMMSNDDEWWWMTMMNNDDEKDDEWRWFMNDGDDGNKDDDDRTMTFGVVDDNDGNTTGSPQYLEIFFSNSLIIHQVKTKEIIPVTMVWKYDLN